jgi:hypothetical protein
MPLRIRYRSADDEETERTISDIVVDPPHCIHAMCHLRSEERTFALSRIKRAIDLDTGEEIPDIWIYFGLPSQKPAPLEMPVFSEEPMQLSTEEAHRQRVNDKRALFGRFKLEVVQAVKRAELFQLFENRCYKCGASQKLELDHHIPQYYGGRLVPGNIVLLCSRCNSSKASSHPSAYYTKDELQDLQALLVAQLQLFDFSFDWSRWDNHPKDYLLSLGVSEIDAEAAAKRREDRIGVSISVRCDEYEE